MDKAVSLLFTLPKPPSTVSKAQKETEARKSALQSGASGMQKFISL